MFGDKKKKDKTINLRGYNVITKYTVPMTPTKSFNSKYQKSVGDGRWSTPRNLTKQSASHKTDDVILIDSDDEFEMEPLTQPLHGRSNSTQQLSPLCKRKQVALDQKPSSRHGQLVIPRTVWRTTVQVAGSISKDSATRRTPKIPLPLRIKVGEAPILTPQSTISTKLCGSEHLSHGSNPKQSSKGIAQSHQSAVPSMAESDAKALLASPILGATTYDPKKFRDDYAKMMETQRKNTPHRFGGRRSSRNLFSSVRSKKGVADSGAQSNALSSGLGNAAHKKLRNKNDKSLNSRRDCGKSKELGDDSRNSPAGRSGSAKSTGSSALPSGHNARTKSIEQKMLHNWLDKLGPGMSRQPRNSQKSQAKKSQSKRTTRESNERLDSVPILQSNNSQVKSQLCRDNAESQDGRKESRAHNGLCAKGKAKRIPRTPEKLDSDSNASGRSIRRKLRSAGKLKSVPVQRKISEGESDDSDTSTICRRVLPWRKVKVVDRDRTDTSSISDKTRINVTLKVLRSCYSQSDEKAQPTTPSKNKLMTADSFTVGKARKRSCSPYRAAQGSSSDKTRHSMASSDPRISTESENMSVDSLDSVVKTLSENDGVKLVKRNTAACESRDGAKKLSQSESVHSSKSSRSGKSFTNGKSPEDRILELIEKDVKNEENFSFMTLQTPNKDVDTPQTLNKGIDTPQTLDKDVDIPQTVDNDVETLPAPNKDVDALEISSKVEDTPQLCPEPSPVLLSKFGPNLLPRKRDRELPFEEKLEAKRQKLVSDTDSEGNSKSVLACRLSWAKKKSREKRLGGLGDGSPLSRRSLFSPPLLQSSLKVRRKASDDSIQKMRQSCGLQVVDNEDVIPARMLSSEEEKNVPELHFNLEISARKMENSSKTMSIAQENVAKTTENAPKRVLDFDKQNAERLTGDSLKEDFSSNIENEPTSQKCLKLKVEPGVKLLHSSRITDDGSITAQIDLELSTPTSGFLGSNGTPNLEGIPSLNVPINESFLEEKKYFEVGDLAIAHHEMVQEKLKADVAHGTIDLTVEDSGEHDQNSKIGSAELVSRHGSGTSEDAADAMVVPAAISEVTTANAAGDGGSTGLGSDIDDLISDVTFEASALNAADTLEGAVHDYDAMVCSPCSSDLQIAENDLESDDAMQGLKQASKLVLEPATCTKPHSLFDFSQFFDDEDDDAYESCHSPNPGSELGDEFPEGLVSVDVTALTKKADFHSDRNEDGIDEGMVDELPDLMKKRKESQSSERSTTDLLAPGDASHDTIIDSDWIADLDVLPSGSRPSRNSKRRFRSVELPTTLKPKHTYKDILADSAFSRTYQKHGASLRRLTREKKKDDELNKMEELLLSDLKKGGFRRILEQEEEEVLGEIEESFDDEKIKKTRKLMKLDCGTLPRLSTSSAIFKPNKFTFCQHKMHLSSCFDEKSFQDLKPRLRREVLRFSSADNTFLYPGILSFLLGSPGTRTQTCKWLLDVVQCHPDSDTVHRIIQSNVREKSFDQPPFTFSQFKSALINSGMSKDVLFCEQEQKGYPDYGICQECLRKRKSPRNAMSVIKLMSTTFHVYRNMLSKDDLVEYAVFLMLIFRDQRLFVQSSEIGQMLLQFLEDLTDWDSLRFLIVQSLLETCSRLVVLEAIVTWLRFTEDRGHELSRIISFAILRVHVFGLEPRDTKMQEFTDLEALIEIIDDFCPETLEALLPEKQEDQLDGEKRAYYHMSLLIPVINVCIGDRCEDSATHVALDRIWNTVRRMNKQIRDNGAIYRSQVKYKLCVFTKRLGTLMQKAPKQNKASIFKYLRSAPVKEEVPIVSMEEPDSSESSDEDSG